MIQSDSRDAPFFIVGSGRSGTSLLRLMLTQHPRIHIPRESWFLTDLMDELPLQGPLTDQQVSTAFDIIRNHWRWREWELSPSLLREALWRAKEISLRDAINETFRLSAGEKPRWGDKTPDYVFEIKRLYSLFPDGKFIHIIRDGRDVGLSHKRVGWRGEEMWNIASYWSKAVRSGCMDGRTLPKDVYKEVIYEELVLNPERVLTETCDFLNEDFNIAMLNFWEHAKADTPDRAHAHSSKTFRPPRDSDVNRWKSEMSLAQIAIFEAAAGDTMEMVGQARHFRRGMKLLRALLNVSFEVAEKSLPFRKRLGLHFPAAIKRRL